MNLLMSVLALLAAILNYIVAFLLLSVGLNFGFVCILGGVAGTLAAYSFLKAGLHELQ